MEVIQTLKEFIEKRSKFNNKSIGLVPTMGNLHRGHLSLVTESLRNNHLTIITIFVNPKQFGAHEDLDKYPRTLTQDCSQIERISLDFPEKEVIIFAAKSVCEIYPVGFDTSISVGKITKILCGKNRPTHFSGVTTVVYQLFQITKPDTAYFGLKDFQQFKVISKMVQDLLIPVKLKALPIVRDDSGLALSSRNQYLTPEHKLLALVLPATLKRLKDIIIEQGLANALALKKDQLNEKKWDYIEILRQDDLQTPDSKDKSLIILGALTIGTTRLIDNLLVEL